MGDRAMNYKNDKYIDFVNKALIITKYSEDGNIEKDTIKFDSLDDIFDLIQDKIFPVYNQEMAKKLEILGFKIVYTKPNPKNEKYDMFYFINSFRFNKYFTLVQKDHEKQKLLKRLKDTV